MATEVTLPRLGQGMESGTIVRWLKAEGDRVEQDEPLYELDTEKVTQEVESPIAGVLLRILVPEGEEIAVGKPICLIGAAGEELAAAVPSGDGKVEEAPAPAAEEAPAPAAEEAAPAVEPPVRKIAAPPEPAPVRELAAPAPGRPKASPLARRIAKERGLDLRRIVGTGPDGRIVADDVERAAAAPPWEAKPVPVEAAAETVPLTSIRRTIARRLTEAWQAPHFAISLSADMRRVIELRETLVARTPESAMRPTFSDVITKLCAVALLRHRALNAHFAGNQIREFQTVNIGFAVAIPAGLVVPVLRSVELQSIPELAAARHDLVERTRAGQLEPADLEEGTFTISNLGMYGIERFFAVLNPPQVAILAVGSIEERPVVEVGEVVVRPRMEMTLSCDHRAVDGATASEFLAALKELLEEPGLAL
jgi:pyruvate dehydrogenase E2 component (dihydrolipoamide acetyltransferase)